MDEVIKGSDWFDGTEDLQLVRELLDNEPPHFLLPEETNIESETISSINEQGINPLISAIYSGPTIRDIEDALSVTSRKEHLKAISQSRISVLERGLTSKIENNKYTLKLKSCGGTGLADDGYKWRKYGQKSIKNSAYPRNYYKCTNPRCSAKKQVERSSEDEDTLIITYEGLHLHFAYPYFLVDPPQHPKPPVKKARRTTSESESNSNETHQTLEEAQEGPSKAMFTGPPPSKIHDHFQESGLEGMGTQGLLEDVVPYMVRNPSNFNASSSNPSSCSSCRSYPTSPSSLSWSSIYSHSCFDVGTNTNIR